MLRKLLIGVLLAGAVAVLAVGGYVVYAVQSLPSVESLKSYRPPVTTRVHAGDGGLIAEFATEQRIFVPIEDIPETLKQAFLSAEDKSFFEHGGIDPWGLVRGAIINPLTGKRQTGGSTITQQVAKNMLLSSDRKLVRKIREAFLAKRIESALDKNTILELYMNQVWLGQRAYGVAAAALNYFDKPLDRLTIAESAYLAALLKGPDNYHPVRRKERAIARRNWVIGQMEKNGFITEAQSKSAQAEDLVSVDRLSGERYVAAAHFVEELRRRALTLPGLRGEKQLYEGGLSIRTTMNTDLQVAAGRALRSGLESYDRRHGWRGPVAAIDLSGDVAAQLQEAPRAPPITGWQRAAVIKADAKGVLVRTIPGEERLLRA
ncbi:MAG: transglycosylase domain-containing protein, partial [Hyphomonadaceae bacterium]|nr:transglycosylase domain-containing protein [Hyphomonadaceae bacterium]